jgi:hypothetical protein
MRVLALQAAADLGNAMGPDDRLLEFKPSMLNPWRQALLKKLGLSNDKKSNLQVSTSTSTLPALTGGFRRHGWHV